MFKKTLSFSVKFVQLQGLFKSMTRILQTASLNFTCYILMLKILKFFSHYFTDFSSQFYYGS